MRWSASACGSARRTPKTIGPLRIPLVMLSIAATLGCAELPTNGEPSDTPVWPGETWDTSIPEAEGIDPAAIEALVADLDTGVYGLVDHFLLIRHGRIVVDRRLPHNYDAVVASQEGNHLHVAPDGGPQYDYDHTDWHPYYQRTDLHTLQSVTKSVTSAALGIAIDAGMIEDVHVPVLPFFDAYEFDRSDPRKSAITLEDFLTMRSGIDWVTTGGYESDEHSTSQLESSDAWVQFVLDRPMDTEPGSVFEYNDGASVLIGKILREATGQRVDQWAAEQLFAPIGIDEFYWKVTPDGEADTEGGLYLTIHDLARVGYLFLRGGEWDGRRILSEAWIAASVAPRVLDVQPDNGRPDPGYGYQWWIPSHEGGKATIYAGNGYGGQFLLVAPEDDVIAVVNGWNIHPGDFQLTFDVLQERIIPALVTGGEPHPED